MKVRHLREQLLELQGHDGGAPSAELTLFLEILAESDDMDLNDFFGRMRTQTADAAGAGVIVSPSENAVAELKRDFWDDAAFAKTLGKIAGDRTATKPLLSEVFYKLFERTRGIPKKISRTELVRLIADERRIIVRNEKMGQLLGRRIVAAE